MKTPDELKQQLRSLCSESEATELLNQIKTATDFNHLDFGQSVDVCAQLLAIGYTAEQLRTCKGIFPPEMAMIAQATTKPRIDAGLLKQFIAPYAQMKGHKMQKLNERAASMHRRLTKQKQPA